MKTIIFIGCIILVFITNYIWYRRGLIRGMQYSLDKTYDVFMLAMYTKLKKIINQKKKLISLYMIYIIY